MPKKLKEKGGEEDQECDGRTERDRDLESGWGIGKNCKR